MTAPPITVVVVDDHDLLREGVSACLEGFPDLSVVGDAPSGEIAIEVVRTVNPDVVVIDLVMPGMGGIETIRALRESRQTLGIIGLSSFSEGDRIRAAIQAGANGYMVKSVDAASLARAVRSAAAGQTTLSPEVTRALTRPESARDRALSSLTSRESEIALLVAKGSTNAEIAQQLELSIFTVKNHVSSILMKFQVQSRTEATAVILTTRGV